jgi:hypothetical protein
VPVTSGLGKAKKAYAIFAAEADLYLALLDIIAAIMG